MLPPSALFTVDSFPLIELGPTRKTKSVFLQFHFNRAVYSVDLYGLKENEQMVYAQALAGHIFSPFESNITCGLHYKSFTVINL